MGEIKGFIVVPNPRRGAEEWFELFRSGRREEAAAQVAEEERRSREATNAVIDALLRELANSRS
jgi:hypothetical protein